jgi:hypothetical protein
VLTAEDYGDGTSMVLGEGKKPSVEKVSSSLQSTALLKGAKDRPTIMLGYQPQQTTIIIVMYALVEERIGCWNVI